LGFAFLPGQKGVSLLASCEFISPADHSFVAICLVRGVYLFTPSRMHTMSARSIFLFAINTAAQAYMLTLAWAYTGWAFALALALWFLAAWLLNAVLRALVSEERFEAAGAVIGSAAAKFTGFFSKKAVEA